jgi:hypothetical protein
MRLSLATPVSNFEKKYPVFCCFMPLFATPKIGVSIEYAEIKRLWANSQKSANMNGVQGVGGSNPLAPISKKKGLAEMLALFISMRGDAFTTHFLLIHHLLLKLL